MPKTPVLKAGQSANGVFRALKTGARRLPRTRPLYRRLVTLRAEHRRRRDALAHALRQHVPPDALRFAVPDGGMYLWCQLEPRVRARAVQAHALGESVMVLTGEPFYMDQGGGHQLRLCYTAQPPARADQAARTIARGIAAAASDRSSSVRLV